MTNPSSEKRRLTPWYKTKGVNGEIFPTKKALQERIRAMVNAAPLGVPLSESDTAFLLGVLVNHPEWVEKAGCGVLSVEVRMNVGAHYANRGLWLVRMDGSEIDISWVVALEAGAPPYRRLLADAARNAVVAQVRAVRDAWASGCAICGGVLGNATHVDHRPPSTFSALLADWASAREALLGGNVPLRDAGTHSEFANEGDKMSWLDHHALFADLQVTHSRCNLSQGGGR